MNLTLKNQIESLESLVSQKELELEQLRSALESLKAASGLSSPPSIINNSKSSSKGISKIPVKKLQANPESRLVSKGSNQVHLTTREYVIFEFLLENVGNVCSREELIEQFESEDEKTARNVDVHVFALRKKLKQIGVAIETAWGAGYKLVG